jgi:Flp pilus assembly pilin Flp
MMTKLYTKILRRWMRPKNRKAQTLVEYALILGLIALAAVAMLTILGTQLQSAFGKVTATLSVATGSGS